MIRDLVDLSSRDFARAIVVQRATRMGAYSDVELQAASYLEPSLLQSSTWAAWAQVSHSLCATLEALRRRELETEPGEEAGLLGGVVMH